MSFSVSFSVSFRHSSVPSFKTQYVMATSAATAARQACAELLAHGIATNCDLASPHDVGDGRTMSTSVLSRLSQFVSRFLGGDAALPQVAVANGFCHHVRTALVVEPSNEAQVSVAVRTAAKWALPLSVASGGHSYICQSVKRGSLHLRLRRLRETHFDPEALTLRMQTGLTFRDVLWRDDVLPANYSIVHGACIDVGVGGFFLHGGANNGNMLRGWSNETIVEMDVVLANGTLVRSLRHDETAHAPLFRALRRSGSSFGVVTALTVQVFSVSP